MGPLRRDNSVASRLKPFCKAGWGCNLVYSWSCIRPNISHLLFLLYSAFFIAMNFVEKAYSTVIGGIFIIFIFCRAANGQSTILSTYCRPFLLTNLVYPASHSGFWSWLPSPLHLVLMVLYSVGTGVCNLIGVQSVSEAGSRAARLSLANLVPMFLSGGFEFGSRLLGVSLETYGAIYRAVGVMAVVQAAIHVAITIQTAQTTLIPAADSR